MRYAIFAKGSPSPVSMERWESRELAEVGLKHYEQDELLRKAKDFEAGFQCGIHKQARAYAHKAIEHVQTMRKLDLERANDPKQEGAKEYYLGRAHRCDDILFWLSEMESRLPADAGPRIICLCGSTRFTEEMCAKSWELAKQGIIALGWNVLLGDAALPNSHGAEQEGVKEQIDELHKRKIDLADEVFVLNIGGYIGQSTRSEIDYAIAQKKPVQYLEPLASQLEVRPLLSQPEVKFGEPKP